MRPGPPVGVLTASGRNVRADQYIPLPPRGTPKARRRLGACRRSSASADGVLIPAVADCRFGRGHRPRVHARPAVRAAQHRREVPPVSQHDPDVKSKEGEQARPRADSLAIHQTASDKSGRLRRRRSSQLTIARSPGAGGRPRSGWKACGRRRAIAEMPHRGMPRRETRHRRRAEECGADRPTGGLGRWNRGREVDERDDR